MLREIPVMFQHFAVACGCSTRHACDMKPNNPRAPAPMRWAIALRRAEKRGDDLEPLAELLSEEPAPHLKRLGKLLRRHRLERLQGKPHSILRELKKDRLINAAQLVRDMRDGVAGTFVDLKRQLKVELGETRFAPIDSNLPQPRKLPQDEAIREVANLTGLDETELREAVAGRTSYLRR
jgi:hypothetical protein